MAPTGRAGLANPPPRGLAWGVCASTTQDTGGVVASGGLEGAATTEHVQADVHGYMCAVVHLHVHLVEEGASTTQHTDSGCDGQHCMDVCEMEWMGPEGRLCGTVQCAPSS